MKKYLLLTTLSLFTANSFAEDADLSVLKSTLQPGVEIQSVKPTPISGIYEVQIQGDILYLSQDGQYVLTGNLFNLSTQENLTAKAASVVNKAKLEKVADSDKIIYKAKDEKYKVTVFTDITCPYCTKLHQQMSNFNDAGITIEYLAFPRAGVGSEPAKTMQRIWCAENKTEAMTQAKLTDTYPTASCDAKTVENQFNLGRELGVNATPTLVFSDGEVSPGYMDAERLLAVLKEKFQ